MILFMSHLFAISKLIDVKVFVIITTILDSFDWFRVT